MNPVLILRSGVPVKLNSDFTVDLDSNGFLRDFWYKGKKHIYLSKADLKQSDFDFEELNDYYPEVAYKMYLNSSLLDLNPIKDLNSAKFDFTPFLAQEGDIVETTIVDFSPPFTYHKRTRVTFPVEAWPQTNYIKKYKKLGKSEIDVPSNSIIQAEIIDRTNTATGYFYQKNFLDVQGSWTNISEELKIELNRLVTKSAFHIHYVVDEILPMLVNAASMAKIDATATRTDGNVDHLTLLEKIIFYLKRDWGYYFGQGTAPHQIHIDRVLPLGPDYSSYVSYYRSIVNFYFSVYKKQYDILLLPKDEIIWYLLQILPYPVFGLVPLNIRLESLRYVAEDLFFLPEFREDVVLKILYSFTAGEAESLLNFLLTTKNGSETYFELLYVKMDDDRQSTFLIPLVGDHNNRRNFVFFIWDLWKRSKYDFTYFPPGQAQNDDKINASSYFLSDQLGISRLNANLVLEFNTTDRLDLFQIISDEQKFRGTIDCDSVNVEQAKVITTIVTDANTGTTITTSSRPAWRPFGTFHLYQPIYLIGYQSNLDLKLPKGNYYPAFVFYYAEDFDKLAELDSNINLALELTLEAAALFFTGGLSVLADIRYLKYITKIKWALQNPLVLGEEVLIWKRLSDGLAAVTVYSSVITSLSSYVANVYNNQGDEEVRNLAKKVSMVFLILSLAHVTGSIASRKKAVMAADDALKDLDLLTQQGKTTFLPNDVKNILVELKGYSTANIAFALNELAPYGNIVSKLQTVADPQLKLAISQILSTSNARVLSRINEAGNYILTISSQSELPKLIRLLDFYDFIYKVSENSWKVKNRIVFSDRVCQMIGERPIPTGTPLHTLEDVSDAIEQGLTLGLNSNVTYGIICKSFRATKQAPISEVLVWLDNYKNFLNNPIPYCFRSPLLNNHYGQFINEVKPLFQEFNLGDKLILGGSALFKTFPPDADFVLYFSKAEIKQMLDYYEDLLQSAKQFVSKTNRSERLETEFNLIEKAIKESRSIEQYGKLNQKCIFSFKVVNGRPKIYYFTDKFSKLESIKKIHVQKPKGFDFSIYVGNSGDEALSVPPEFLINL
jgi:hypothetical protein